MADKTINQICPLTGDDIDPKINRRWRGQVVGFCSPSCAVEWDDLTDAERERLLREQHVAR